MRVISKARLKQFWEIPDYKDADGPLKAWHTHVSAKTVAWQSWGDVKAEFGTASLVGNCVVFNIGGNKYRLVTRILYPSQKVFILKILTHEAYDDDKWKSDCGCYDPAPKRKAKSIGKRQSNVQSKRKASRKVIDSTPLKPKQKRNKRGR
jgi:mRNA interferase HigB